MAHDSADDTLSDELDRALENEPADELLRDQLLGSAADVPIVEPRLDPTPRPRDETRGLVRALWFFGIVITALFVLQTVQLFLSRGPREVAANGPGPSIRSSPLAPSPTPAEEVDRTLRDMRVRLSRNLYEDVVRVLEPKALDPGLDKDQRFEAYLLLAKAHRALGNQEKAQMWQLRATDQMVERREPAQILEYAGALADQGQLAEARAELLKLLARRDGLTKKDEQWLSIAEARVADAWYAQAKRTKQLAPLPGTEREVRTAPR
jgi:hypothetical protein